MATKIMKKTVMWHVICAVKLRTLEMKNKVCEAPYIAALAAKSKRTTVKIGTTANYLGLLAKAFSAFVVVDKSQTAYKYTVNRELFNKYTIADIYQKIVAEMHSEKTRTAQKEKTNSKHVLMSVMLDFLKAGTPFTQNDVYKVIHGIDKNIKEPTVKAAVSKISKVYQKLGHVTRLQVRPAYIITGDAAFFKNITIEEIREEYSIYRAQHRNEKARVQKKAADNKVMEEINEEINSPQGPVVTREGFTYHQYIAKGWSKEKMLAHGDDLFKPFIDAGILTEAYTPAPTAPAEPTVNYSRPEITCKHTLSIIHENRLLDITAEIKDGKLTISTEINGTTISQSKKLE